jgi:hypothetical protein
MEEKKKKKKKKQEKTRIHIISFRPLENSARLQKITNKSDELDVIIDKYASEFRTTLSNYLLRCKRADGWVSQVIFIQGPCDYGEATAHIELPSVAYPLSPEQWEEVIHEFVTGKIRELGATDSSLLGHNKLVRKLAKELKLTNPCKLLCYRCLLPFPDDAFTVNAALKNRRGRHYHCRDCA